MVPFRKFRSAIAAFRRDRAGNVLVVFSLCLLPAVTMGGVAIDYAQSIKHRARVTAAADSAALEAVITARSDSLANLADTTAIAHGKAQGKRAFAANLAGIHSIQAQTPTVSVTRSGQTFSASLTYSATSSLFFSKLLHVNSVTMSGTATASVDLPLYNSYHLLLDVSGSMGIPSTTAGQNRLSSINPDMLADYPTGCNFACHFAGYQGYTLSRTNGTGVRVANDYCPQPGLSTCIQLKLDAVAYALQQVLQVAQQKRVVDDQFAIGLFPFITHMLAYQPLSTDMSVLNSMAANIPSLLDVGTSPNTSGNLGSGGTHFDSALQELNTAITSIGNGSSISSRAPYVFLVTDGAQDNQYQANGTWWGSNSATTINTANCTLLKNRGITIAVLYIPYVPIANPNPAFANDEDDYANWNIPNIPPALTACATSPEWFFTANTPADVTAMMEKAFNQTLRAARLTH